MHKVVGLLPLVASFAVSLAFASGLGACAKQKELESDPQVQAARKPEPPPDAAPPPDKNLVVDDWQLTIPGDWEPEPASPDPTRQLWKLKREVSDPRLAGAVLGPVIPLGPSLEAATRAFGKNAKKKIIEEALKQVADDVIKRGGRVLAKEVDDDGFLIESIGPMTMVARDAGPGLEDLLEKQMQRVVVSGKGARNFSCTWGHMDPKAPAEVEAALRATCVKMVDSFKKLTPG